MSFQKLKDILKAIEYSKPSRSPRIALEALILKENWYRVWDEIEQLENLSSKQTKNGEENE